MAGKKKISKKELLKKPDEFITLSTRTLGWVKDNASKAIWIVSGLVLLLVLYFGYTAYRNRQERLGHEKYFSSLEITDPDQKLKKLEEMVKRFPEDQGRSFRLGDYRASLLPEKRFSQGGLLLSIGPEQREISSDLQNPDPG